mgnify:FL=1
MNKKKVFTFPEKLEIIKQGLIDQQDVLLKAAELYADAIENNGLIHVYANGHSKISAEENVIRDRKSVV